MAARKKDWAGCLALLSLACGVLSILATAFLYVLTLPVGESIVRVDRLNNTANRTGMAMFVCGLAAVILGSIAHRTTDALSASRAQRRLAAVGILLGSLTLVATCFVITVLTNGRGFRLVSVATRSSTCRNYLRQVAFGIELYRAENGGQFPPDLQTLYAGGGLPEPSVLVCPSNAGKTRLDLARLDETSDYCYIPPASSVDLGMPIPIAWEKVPMHIGNGVSGVNAMFSDLHVEYVAADKLDTEIAKNAELYGRTPSPLVMPQEP